MVQKHAEHVGHELEHYLHAATAIDALGVANLGEEAPERVIEAPGMLPKMHLGRVCGGAPKERQGRERLPLAHTALEPPQHSRDDILWGDPRRTALQTAVTKEPRTRHGGRQYGHLLESHMVLEHLLQHAIGGSFRGRGKVVHSVFR